MIIYIDTYYKCHVTNDGTMTAVETDFFDGKCDAYVEGYRYIPHGFTWNGPDGTVFTGEMVAPWKPLGELDIFQRAYEQERYQEIVTENAELLEAMAAMVDDVYNQDLGEMEE